MKQGRESHKDKADKDADRDREPSGEDWAALCRAVMRCEVALEKVMAKGGRTPAARSARAIATRLRKLQHEPACRWLLAHPAYRTAAAAYVRRVGDTESDRFELLSAISYAMEILYADEPPASPLVATAAVRRQAIRHAHELAVLVARDGAGFDRPEQDEALLALLQRYIAESEKLARAAPVAKREPERQLRFGKDLAHLLYVAVGTAPPSVVRPLLRLAGPPVSERDVSALLAQVRREAQVLEARRPARRNRNVLDRIVIAATARPRKTAGAVK